MHLNIMRQCFKCDCCGKLLGSYKSLYTHKKARHPLQVFPCGKCCRKFTEAKEVLKHDAVSHKRTPSKLQQGSKLKKIKCPICYKLVSGHFFQTHKKRHCETKSCICDVCDKPDANLPVHVKKEANINKQFLPIVRARVRCFRRHNGRFICNLCEEEYTTKAMFSEHYEAFHGGNRYPCKICKKTFSAMCKLKMHLPIHDPNRKKIKCPICSKEIAPVWFESHKNMHKNIDKELFKCNLCNRPFGSSIILRRHKQDVHLKNHRYKWEGAEEAGQTNIQCGMCSQVFPTKEKFVGHTMKLVGQLYTCCKCQKKFKSCVSLYEHYEAHRAAGETLIVDDDGEIVEEEEVEELVLNYGDNEEVIVQQPAISETNELLYILDDSQCVNEVVIEEDHPPMESAAQRSERETVEIVNLEHGYVMSNMDSFIEEEEEDEDGNIIVTRRMTLPAKPTTSKRIYTQPKPRAPQPKRRHEVPDFSATNYIFLSPNEEVDVPHYKCLRCEQLFINKFVFFRHIEKGKCYINNCDVCTATFSKNSDFYEHYIAEHTDRAICNFCFRTFMYEKNVKEHMLRHLDQFRHRCEDCNKGFYTVREYRNHYKNRHMGIRHKCEIQFIANRWKVKQEVLKNLQEYVDKYDLKECQIILQDVTECFEIIDNRAKLPRFKYKCYICLETFMNHTELLCHKLKFTKQQCRNFAKLRPKRPIKKKRKRASKIFTCQFCLKIFLNRKDLFHHQFSNHDNSTQVPTQSEPVIRSSKILIPYQIRPSDGIINNTYHHCLKCYKNFLFIHDLKEHVQKDECRMVGQCYLCLTPFEKNWELWEHMISEHPQQPICVFCYKLFPTIKQLGLHKRVHHFKRFAAVCPTCWKGLSRQKIKKLLSKYGMRECKVRLCDIKYDKTIKIINNSAKLPSSHTCLVCDKIFSTARELNKHRRVHEDLSYTPEEDEKPTSVKKAKSTPKPAPMKNTIKNYFKKAERTHTIIHKCIPCNATFTCVEKIKKHPPNKCQFVCGACARSYNTIHAFTVHVLQHKINVVRPAQPANLHKCSICSESFDDYIDLKTHGILMHKLRPGDQPETNGDDTSENSNDVDEIICELCFDIFDSKEKLDEHMEFHKELHDKPNVKQTKDDSVELSDSDDESTDIEEKKPSVEPKTKTHDEASDAVPVIESTYSLANTEDGNSSKKSVEKEASISGYKKLPSNESIPKEQYQCKKCDRVYMSVKEYEEHLEKQCKVEKICSVCSISVDGNSKRYEHIVEHHPSLIICKLCFEPFAETRQLEKHKLQKHLHSFKNVCKICFKCFMSYQEFNEHLQKEHLNLG
ncbi:hypothetical protein NQ315_004252 [Exocentrus adspersus]|uniref:C2H2-type domain-containing protein n=1 Tax=Exocentrus adspersus TaxID=1586481 RepID=A0AAV8W8E5_9CUCU|nr:hypothetical protein NQ315_004252 [Exocentrus adspersus]